MKPSTLRLGLLLVTGLILLALWPIRQFARGGISFLEGGGTVPFLSLLPNGLNALDHPDWDGRSATVRTPQVWSKHADVRVDEEKGGTFAMFAELTATWTNPLSNHRSAEACRPQR